LALLFALLCLLLVISGCLFPPERPTGEGLQFEVFVKVEEYAPNLSFMVFCGNGGSNPKNVNVSEFAWLFGANPSFSVLAPDGTVYDGMDLRNVTMAPKYILLQTWPAPGANCTTLKTYDLLAQWTAWRRSDGVRLSTTEVFSHSRGVQCNSIISPLPQRP
jgi:hypothetical protein